MLEINDLHLSKYYNPLEDIQQSLFDIPSKYTMDFDKFETMLTFEEKESNCYLVGEENTIQAYIRDEDYIHLHVKHAYSHLSSTLSSIPLVLYQNKCVRRKLTFTLRLHVQYDELCLKLSSWTVAQLNDYLKRIYNEDTSIKSDISNFIFIVNGTIKSIIKSCKKHTNYLISILTSGIELEEDQIYVTYTVTYPLITTPYVHGETSSILSDVILSKLTSTFSIMDNEIKMNYNGTPCAHLLPNDSGIPNLFMNFYSVDGRIRKKDFYAIARNIVKLHPYQGTLKQNIDYHIILKMLTMPCIIFKDYSCQHYVENLETCVDIDTNSLDVGQNIESILKRVDTFYKDSQVIEKCLNDANNHIENNRLSSEFSLKTDIDWELGHVFIKKLLQTIFSKNEYYNISAVLSYLIQHYTPETFPPDYFYLYLDSFAVLMYNDQRKYKQNNEYDVLFRKAKEYCTKDGKILLDFQWELYTPSKFIHFISINIPSCHNHKQYFQIINKVTTSWIKDSRNKFMEKDFLPMKRVYLLNRKFNTFNGYYYTEEDIENANIPEFEDNLDTIKAFIFQVICGGNKEIYNHFLYLLKNKVQNPCFKCDYIFIIKGSQGIGKSLFMEWLLLFFKNYTYCIGSLKQLTDDFNLLISEKLVGWIEEFKRPDARMEDILNYSITVEKRVINPKYTQQYYESNHILWFATADFNETKSSYFENRRYCISFCNNSNTELISNAISLLSADKNNDTHHPLLLHFIHYLVYIHIESPKDRKKPDVFKENIARDRYCTTGVDVCVLEYIKNALIYQKLIDCDEYYGNYCYHTQGLPVEDSQFGNWYKYIPRRALYEDFIKIYPLHVNIKEDDFYDIIYKFTKEKSITSFFEHEENGKKIIRTFAIMNRTISTSKITKKEIRCIKVLNYLDFLKIWEIIAPHLKL